METIDLSKQLKELYSAKRQPSLVLAEKGVFLAADGQGEPGGEVFQRLIGALYAVTYTAKFTCKFAGEFDFKVGRFECLYLCDPCQVPKADWQWRLLIRVPAELKAKHVTAAQTSLREKKGLDTSAVYRLSWREGRAVQALHVGPYDQVGETFNSLTVHAEALGWQIQGPAHEIYLNDPQRVAPEKLKTIVRLAVKK